MFFFYDQVVHQCYVHRELTTSSVCFMTLCHLLEWPSTAFILARLFHPQGPVSGSVATAEVQRKHTEEDRP